MVMIQYPTFPFRPIFEKRSISIVAICSSNRWLHRSSNKNLAIREMGIPYAGHGPGCCVNCSQMIPLVGIIKRLGTDTVRTTKHRLLVVNKDNLGLLYLGVRGPSCIAMLRSQPSFL